MIVDLSERILYLIESKGVTVYEVSLVTGISQASLSRIINKETNKLQLKNINLLANYFNISPDWLRSGNGEMLLSNNINNTPDVNKDTINQYNMSDMNDEIKKLSKQIEFLTDVVNRGLNEHSEFMKKYEMKDYVKFSDLGERGKGEDTGT